MYISWSVHRKESCFKVAECIYYGVFIARKVVLKLRNVYIMECSSQGKLFKVTVCISHRVFITRKAVLKLRNVYIMVCSSQRKLIKSCGMYMSWSVHRKESCFILAVIIYHPVFIERKVFLKLRLVYIIKFLSKGKLFYSCGMYISCSVHLKENCFTVAVCTYHAVFISRKVVLKLRNVYIIKCSSQEKLF